uniref:Uncharacterized protein n=1 Tax=Hyaloperonospora arabidopsidis (strain Emoy2) TaxID=559515 RepID=M4BKB2_HYAAE
MGRQRYTIGEKKKIAREAKKASLHPWTSSTTSTVAASTTGSIKTMLARLTRSRRSCSVLAGAMAVLPVKNWTLFSSLKFVKFLQAPPCHSPPGRGDGGKDSLDDGRAARPRSLKWLA